MKKIFITGGTGTVGKAFITKYYKEYKFYSFSRNEKSLKPLELSCATFGSNKSSLSTAIIDALQAKFKNPHSSKCPGVVADDETATTDPVCSMSGKGYTIITSAEATNTDAAKVTIATDTGGDPMTMDIEIE